jgi:serine/threonine protein kinase
MPKSMAPSINPSLASKMTVKASTDTNLKIKKLKIEDLEIRNTLGTGSFGRVHLVKYKPTGKHYAMKVLKKAEIIKLRQVEHTMNEKQILEQLDFPFLVKILGTFQDSNNLFLVLEYVQGGELFTYLRKSGVSFLLIIAIS